MKCIFSLNSQKKRAEGWSSFEHLINCWYGFHNNLSPTPPPKKKSIHVRRTDKLRWEAKFHGIEEYMDHVEKYYQELEKREAVSVRRVFLATDEVGLLYEAQKKWV